MVGDADIPRSHEAASVDGFPSGEPFGAGEIQHTKRVV